MAIAFELVIKRARHRKARDPLGPAASRANEIPEPLLTITNHRISLGKDVGDLEQQLTKIDSRGVSGSLLSFDSAKDLAKTLHRFSGKPCTTITDAWAVRAKAPLEKSVVTRKCLSNYG